MKITVSNTSGIPNKYIRLLKWKLYHLARKFNDLHYADIFVKKEGSGNTVYQTVLRLGVPGHDIILRHKAHSPAHLIADTYKDARRYLARRSKSYRS